jgi:hypothetical protein
LQPKQKKIALRGPPTEIDIKYFTSDAIADMQVGEEYVKKLSYNIALWYVIYSRNSVTSTKFVSNKCEDVC